MKIRFQADADVDPDVWRGLYRREPMIDLAGHVGVIPDGTPDLLVLKMASEAGRVLVSGDVATMLVAFNEFITRNDSPGLVLIPSRRTLSEIIGGIRLVWANWTPDQLRNQAFWLPPVKR